jgi:competence protein ComEA
MKNPFSQILTPSEQRVILIIAGIIMLGSVLSLAGYQGQKTGSEISDSLRVALAEEIPLKVDIRSASAQELMAIPGIGQKRADDIIEYRRQDPFENVIDLIRVSGIGAGIYRRSYPYLVVFGDSLLPESSTADKTILKPNQEDVINLNTAELEQLCTLKGIGPAKAKAILEYRDLHGRFEDISDFLKVNGIGAKTIEANLNRIAF